MGVVPTDECIADGEQSDIPGTEFTLVPIPSNLLGVFTLYDWIEDGLVGQARWELLPTRCLDEVELFKAHGAVEDHRQITRFRSQFTRHVMTRQRLGAV